MIFVENITFQQRSAVISLSFGLGAWIGHRQIAGLLPQAYGFSRSTYDNI